MRICYVIIIIGLLCCGLAQASGWQAVKSEHFVVYYKEDKNFAGETLRQAEKYYNKIASDLGYSRYDKFWQWENRVKIYIYPTREDFVESTGIERQWANGMANYEKKEIISYKWSKGFTESLLPHELTHLIFRDFVGFTGKIPLWLDEGVAQWEEKARGHAIKIVKNLIKDGNYIPVRRLMAMDVRHEDNYELARNFYAQATTLVGYLIEEYGGIKFSLFCRQLRDGKSVDEALSFVYANSIRSVDELEKKWLKYYGGG
ncbi:MAG: hypothetical protein ISS90_00835 [Candidatus Omnitrophica bacterium]|nr:hypothetical protein [Candidatus Omnitrophota bacterium]